jgi:hypothetical protein
MIDKKTVLQHLNLESTGIFEQITFLLANLVHKAKSLIALHLSYNKGVTDRSKEFMRKTIKAKNHQKRIKFNPGLILRVH